MKISDFIDTVEGARSLRVKSGDFRCGFSCVRLMGSRKIFEVIPGFFLPSYVVKNLKKFKNGEVVTDPCIDSDDGNDGVKAIISGRSYRYEFNTIPLRMLVLPPPLDENGELDFLSIE